MLPFEPEPIDALRARYPQAVATVFQMPSRPFDRREQVFDFEDGLCLIVSRQQTQGRPVHLYIVAFAHTGTTLKPALGDEQFDRNAFIELAAARFREISGDDRPLSYDGVTPSGLVHKWLRQEKEVAVV